MTSPSVLIVDDEPPIRRLLRTSLSAQGWRVAEAANAAEAMAQLARREPDVIILDLGLPDRDGLDVVREVRETSSVPIVVLSSRDAERTKLDALELGADDYVTKPFDMNELMARLRAALRHRLPQDSATPTPAFHSGDLDVDL